MMSFIASLFHSTRRPWIAFAALFTIAVTIALLLAYDPDSGHKGPFQFSMAVGSYFIGIASVAYGSRARVSAMIFFCGGLLMLLAGWEWAARGSGETLTDSIIDGSMTNAGGLIGAFFTKVLQDMGPSAEELRGPPGPEGPPGRDGAAGADGRDAPGV